MCSLKLTLYSPSRGDNHYLALYSKMHNKPYLWIFKKRKGCAFIWKRRESMKKNQGNNVKKSLKLNIQFKFGIIITQINSITFRVSFPQYPNEVS